MPRPRAIVDVLPENLQVCRSARRAFSLPAKGLSPRVRSTPSRFLTFRAGHREEMGGPCPVTSPSWEWPHVTRSLLSSVTLHVSALSSSQLGVLRAPVTLAKTQASDCSWTRRFISHVVRRIEPPGRDTGKGWPSCSRSALTVTCAYAPSLAEGTAVGPALTHPTVPGRLPAKLGCRTPTEEDVWVFSLRRRNLRRRDVTSAAELLSLSKLPEPTSRAVSRAAEIMETSVQAMTRRGHRARGQPPPPTGTRTGAPLPRQERPRGHPGPPRPAGGSVVRSPSLLVTARCESGRHTGQRAVFHVLGKRSRARFLLVSGVSRSRLLQSAAGREKRGAARWGPSPAVHPGRGAAGTRSAPHGGGLAVRGGDTCSVSSVP